VLTGVINQTKYRWTDLAETDGVVDELLAKHGLTNYKIEVLRPQSHADDQFAIETMRISLSYDEDESERIWVQALTEISLALSDRGFDLAVEFIDKSKFPPLYSHGLEEDFGMTAEEWKSAKDTTVKYLTKKGLIWSSIFAMRLGTSSILSENPATLIITTPNPGLIQTISHQLLQQIGDEWIKAIYPALCIRLSTQADAVSSYGEAQFDNYPDIGVGYSVGIRENPGATATLGGTLELVYDDGKRVRVGLTNFHPIRQTVKNDTGKLTSQRSSFLSHVPLFSSSFSSLTSLNISFLSYRGVFSS
jgi:hypothetical protein